MLFGLKLLVSILRGSKHCLSKSSLIRFRGMGKFADLRVVDKMIDLNVSIIHV